MDAVEAETAEVSDRRGLHHVVHRHRCILQRSFRSARNLELLASQSAGADDLRVMGSETEPAIAGGRREPPFRVGATKNQPLTKARDW